jgi:hypothetical protein
MNSRNQQNVINRYNEQQKALQAAQAAKAKAAMEQSMSQSFDASMQFQANQPSFTYTPGTSTSGTTMTGSSGAYVPNVQQTGGSTMGAYIPPPIQGVTQFGSPLGGAPEEKQIVGIPESQFRSMSPLQQQQAIAQYKQQQYTQAGLGTPTTSGSAPPGGTQTAQPVGGITNVSGPSSPGDPMAGTGGAGPVPTGGGTQTAQPVGGITNVSGPSSPGSVTLPPGTTGFSYSYNNPGASGVTVGEPPATGAPSGGPAEGLSYQEYAQQMMEGQNPSGAPPEYQAQLDAQNQERQGFAGELSGLQGRYDDIAGQYQDRENRLMGYLEGYGDTEKQQLEQHRQQLLSKAQQDLLNRGLSTSTVLDSVRRGIESGSAADLSALNERLNKERMTYASQLSGESLAAQQDAAQFANQQTMQRYGMSQDYYGRMQSATESGISQRQSALDRGLEQGIAGRGLATDQYKAQLAAATEMGKAQLNFQSGQQNIPLEYAKLQASTGLGYAELGQRSQLAQLDAQTRLGVAQLGQNPYDQARGAALQQTMLYNNQRGGMI